MTFAQPPVLSIRGLCVDFPSRHGTFRAVRNVSLEITPGEILGIVGESGAGKSTVGAAITGLLQAISVVPRGDVKLSRFPVAGAGRDIDAAMQWLLEGETEPSSTKPDALIELRGVERVYGVTRSGGMTQGAFKARQNVNLSIRYGEVMGLVGESGSGKSTMARIVAGLNCPSSGQLMFSGKDVYAATVRRTPTHPPSNPNGVPRPLLVPELTNARGRNNHGADGPLWARKRSAPGRTDNAGAPERRWSGVERIGPLSARLLGWPTTADFHSTGFGKPSAVPDLR